MPGHVLSCSGCCDVVMVFPMELFFFRAFHSFVIQVVPWNAFHNAQWSRYFGRFSAAVPGKVVEVINVHRSSMFPFHD